MPDEDHASNNYVLDDQQIQDLIDLPKTIISKEPAEGYYEERFQRRCTLELESIGDESIKFGVFIRQHTEFIENFTFGLRYQTNDRSMRSITLVRYNGAHGETSRQVDGHYAAPHIHRITQTEMESGSSFPQEKHREITEQYATFEQGLAVFFTDIGAVNFTDHFREALQGRLFDGHC